MSARTAAARALLVEPGTLPPDMASASDTVILERLRQRAAVRRAQAAKLRLDAEASQHYVDIWAHIRSGMALPEVDHPTVHAELAWYARRPEYIQRTTDRARLYLGHIVQEAARRKLPLELALLPVVESGFQPYARSPTGAMGLWQFIRSTGRHYGLEQTAWSDARRDIVQATRAAFDYLQKLHNDMDGDWLLAIAAYNAGEGNVLRAVRKNRAQGEPIDFFSLSLPAETRAYVPRLLAFAKLVARPADYDIELDAIDDRPYFQRVQIGTRIDLAKAAQMAEITLDELMLLNPALMRETTDPAGPHSLLVPVESVAAFRKALAATPKDERIAWFSVQVARGDTLSVIAERNSISVRSLREANDLRSNTIRVGQLLRVPGRQGSAATPRLNTRTPVKQSTEHVVKSGDNLWSIARRYRLRTADLARWNGIKTTAVLRPGQRLRLNPPASA